MTLFEVDETLTVGQLNRRLGEAIRRAVPTDVWVQGQIRNLSRSGRGHVYFDLVEPVPAGAQPKAAIPVTLFDSNKQIVNRTIRRTGNNMRIDDGVEVRIRANIDFYAPRGRVQLNMSAIDPDFTIGRLSADREQLLTALRGEGLLGANAQHQLVAVPLRVGLITGHKSAAEADFVQQLRSSPYAFDITRLKARVQGEFAPDEIATAVAGAQSLPIDVIALVRGGGARTDLAAFEAEMVARAIASSTIPVLTGIGHETDQSVADLVAYQAFKTPTACAQFLVEQVAAFDLELQAKHTELLRLSHDAIRRQQARLAVSAQATIARCQTTIETAASRNERAAVELERRVGARMQSSSSRLNQIDTTIRIRSDSALRQALRRCDHSQEALGRLVPQHLREAERRLDVIAAQVGAADPVKAMQRGWSTTRTADGAVVRSIGELANGDRIVTHLADGTVTSTVQARQAKSRD